MLKIRSKLLFIALITIVFLVVTATIGMNLYGQNEPVKPEKQDKPTQIPPYGMEKKELNTYVVELWHEVRASGLGGLSTRKFVNEVILKAVPKLLEEKNIKQIAVYHLDPEHRVIAIFEAPSIEILRDFLYESGYMHIAHATIHIATPMDHIMEWQTRTPWVWE